MVKDPVADFLVRIKNAQAVKKESIDAPYSKFLWEIAKILEREGYVAKVERRGKRMRRSIEAGLIYDESGSGKISGTRRVSHLSQRIYKKAADIHPPRHGFGTQIVSTSKGLMTAQEARRTRVGGEILFEIW